MRGRLHSPTLARTKALTDLVGELCTRSELFRTRWATHIVLVHRTGAKSIRHPVVGELTLDYDALNLLASWAATTDRNDTSDPDTRPTATPQPGTSA